MRNILRLERSRVIIYILLLFCFDGIFITRSCSRASLSVVRLPLLFSSHIQFVLLISFQAAYKCEKWTWYYLYYTMLFTSFAICISNDSIVISCARTLMSSMCRRNFHSQRINYRDDLFYSMVDCKSFRWNAAVWSHFGDGEGKKLAQNTTDYLLSK